MSLSHFEDQCIPSGSTSPMMNNQYFLMSNITNPGSQPGNMKRHPQPEEQQVLADIGYSVRNYFGDSSNVNHNYISYDTSYTAAGQVVANNDGVNNGVYTFKKDTTGNFHFTGNALLGNDTGVNGGSFEGLQMISGTGTFSVSSGSSTTSVTLTGGNGMQTFRYVPVSSSGKRGNVAYGSVNSTMGTGTCTTDNCNLIPNPGFESSTGCGDVSLSAVTLDCWTSCFLTPDLYRTICANYLVGWSFSIPNTNTASTILVDPSNATSPNNVYMGLWSEYYPGYGNPHAFEGLQVPLNAPLAGNTTYTISLWARVADILPFLSYSFANLPGNIGIALSNGALTLNPLPSAYNVVANLNVPAPNGAWTPFTVTFTTPGGSSYDNFIIYNAIDRNISSWPAYTYPTTQAGQLSYSSYILIDDIRLTQYSISTFIPPSTISVCASPLTDLSQYISPFVSGGTFSGPGVTQANNGTFDPSQIGPVTTNTTVTIGYTYVDANCGSTTIYADITVLPSAPVTATPDPICPGSTVTLSTSAFTSCNWYANGTNMCMSCSPTITDNPTINTVYMATDASNTTCSGYVTVSMLNLSSSIALSGNAIVCLNNTMPTITATPANSSYTYSWQVRVNGGSWSTISTATGAYTMTPSISTAGFYEYQVVISTGICSATSNIVGLTVNPVPTATLTGNPLTICATPGAAVHLVAGPAGNSYVFNVYTSSSSTHVPSPSQYYSVNSPLGQSFYTVTVTDYNGCSSTSPFVFVTLDPIPNPSITPAQAFACPGGSATFSTPAVAGYTYLWYNGTTSTGVTTPQITTTVPGNYSVVVSNGTCSGSSGTSVFTLLYAPTVTVNASGPLTFCAGSSVTLTANASPVSSYSYQWYNNGILIPTGTGSTYTATTTGNYSVTVTDLVEGCSTTTNATTVTVYTVPAPTINLQGTVTICQGSSLVLSTATVTGYTYLWYNGTTSTGVTTPSYTATAAGSYSVVVANGSCTGTSAATVLVIGSPGVTVSASGTTTFCAGGSVTLTANATPSGPTYTYQWYDNGVVINSATSATYTASTTGNYTVAVTNTTASCSTTSVATAVTASAPPTVSLTSGPINICSSGNPSVATLSTTVATGYTYQWYSGTTATTVTNPISGATSATYQTSTAGYYSVMVTNGSCSATSPTPTQVILNQSPSVTVSDEGTSICAGGNMNLATSVYPSGYGYSYSYQWLNYGSPISTTTNSTANGHIFSANAAGSYTVVVTNTATGCSVTSTPPIVMTVLPAPVLALTGTTPNCTEVLTVTVNGVVSCPACTYQWQESNQYLYGPGTASSSLTATSTGSYLVTVQDGPCNVTSSPIQVNLGGGCTPCGVFAGPNYTTLSGAIPAGTYTGNIYISSPVTVSGTVNFGTLSTPAYILVAPNGATTNTIAVGSGATLNIVGSHLESCGGQWGGIVMSNGGGTLNISSSNSNSSGSNATLIENATTAISSTYNNIIHCSGAIFNKDSYGISITNYTGSASNITIANNVFTNSVVQGSNITIWPILTTLKTTYTPSDVYFSPPYNLANPLNTTYYPGGPTSSTGMTALAGANAITLTNVNNITIGDNGQGTNFFNNYKYGIYSTYSVPTPPLLLPNNGNNLTLNNNIFANMGADGVYGSNVGTGSSLLLSVVGAVHNEFWSCASSCVEASGYANITAQGAKMTGNHINGIPTNAYGYNITTGAYVSVNISNNNITNVGIGICEKGVAGFFPSPYWVPSPTANITISGNTIEADPNMLGSATTTNRYVQTGIQISASAGSSYLTGYGGTVTVNNNPMWDVYNGISATGFAPQVLSITNHKIRMYQLPSSASQYGITQYLCTNSKVNGNEVYCSSLNNSADKMRGFSTSVSSGSVISCNNIHDIGRGFEFWNQPSGVTLKWYPGNQMQNNYKGMVIYKNGIGAQGALPVGTTQGTLIGNLWQGNNWFNTNPNQSLDHFTIYTDGAATVAASKMYCNSSSSVYYPTQYNGASNPGNSYSYFAGNGLYPCNNCTTPTPPCTKGGNGNSGNGVGIQLNNTQNYQVADMEQVAQDSIVYSDDQNINRWMAQNTLYNAIQGRVVYNDDTAIDGTDSTITSYEYLTDSSAILSAFNTLAQNSRYKFLTDIGAAIAVDSLDYARYLITNMPASSESSDPTTGAALADNSDADYIVANYLSYYSIAANFTDSTMSLTDSNQLVALANLCPVINGDVVYRARALYYIVFNDAPVWDDDVLCGNNSGQQGRTASPRPGIAAATGSQNYRLSPNPNDGHMTLQQAVKDGNPVAAEVWNAIGQPVTSAELFFNERMATLNIGHVAPGMYLLKLYDSEGKRYVLKFVVN